MKSLIKNLSRYLILTAIAGLVACSTEEIKDPTVNWTAKEFYIEARHNLRIAEFEQAIKNLETLEARFPFSEYAKQAQLDVAYAYFKFDEPDSAISAADRFIRLHPRNPHVDYAIYIKGLANFYRGVGILEAWFPRNMADHDPKNMKLAITDFSNLIRRYPDSIYAPDAYLRSLYLRNKLAEAEIVAAEYYIKRDAWVAAINRAQYVLEHYQRAPARNRALEIMIEGYTQLGMDDLAADTRQILKMNNLPAVNQVSATDIKTPEPPVRTE